MGNDYLLSVIGELAQKFNLISFGRATTGVKRRDFARASIFATSFAKATTSQESYAPIYAQAISHRQLCLVLDQPFV